MERKVAPENPDNLPIDDQGSITSEDEALKDEYQAAFSAYKNSPPELLRDQGSDSPEASASGYVLPGAVLPFPREDLVKLPLDDKTIEDTISSASSSPLKQRFTRGGKPVLTPFGAVSSPRIPRTPHNSPVDKENPVSANTGPSTPVRRRTIRDTPYPGASRETGLTPRTPAVERLKRKLEGRRILPMTPISCASASASTGSFMDAATVKRLNEPAVKTEHEDIKKEEKPEETEVVTHHDEPVDSFEKTVSKVKIEDEVPAKEVQEEIPDEQEEVGDEEYPADEQDLVVKEEEGQKEPKIKEDPQVKDDNE